MLNLNSSFEYNLDIEHVRIRLIIPVLVILGVVIIAALVIVFWK
jgi:hypothetical protein